MLNEKYMAVYIWLFAIYSPNFDKNSNQFFKLLLLLGMGPKSHSNMILISSSCRANSI